MRKLSFAITICSLLSISSAACSSAGTNAAREPAPMPFGSLATEFKQSKEATRDKYKGKSLIVKGFTNTGPIMPNGPTDAGILMLSEKGGDLLYMLSCQFTAAEKAEFSRVTGNQVVTVTGVFDDDLAMTLKSCRILNVE